MEVLIMLTLCKNCAFFTRKEQKYHKVLYICKNFILFFAIMGFFLIFAVV